MSFKNLDVVVGSPAPSVVKVGDPVILIDPHFRPRAEVVSSVGRVYFTVGHTFGGKPKTHEQFRIDTGECRSPFGPKAMTVQQYVTSKVQFARIFVRSLLNYEADAALDDATVLALANTLRLEELESQVGDIDEWRRYDR